MIPLESAHGGGRSRAARALTRRCCRRPGEPSPTVRRSDGTLTFHRVQLHVDTRVRSGGHGYMRRETAPRSGRLDGDIARRHGIVRVEKDHIDRLSCDSNLQSRRRALRVQHHVPDSRSQTGHHRAARRENRVAIVDRVVRGRLALAERRSAQCFAHQPEGTGLLRDELAKGRGHADRARALCKVQCALMVIGDTRLLRLIDREPSSIRISAGLRGCIARCRQSSECERDRYDRPEHRRSNLDNARNARQCAHLSTCSAEHARRTCRGATCPRFEWY